MLPDNFANLSQAQKDQYFATGKVGAVAGTNTMGASVLSPTINSSALNPTPAITIPPKPAPQNLAPQVAGGNATIQANSQSLATPATPVATPTQATPTQAPTVTDSFVNSLKTKLGIIPQAEAAPVKQKADITPVANTVQEGLVAQDALNLAQNKLTGLNAEAENIINQGKTDALSVEGQGRGIDQTILSRQASEINRQAAIRASALNTKILAAQGEVLAAQAKVASAQGKTQMAQFLYNDAQGKLNDAYDAQVINWQSNKEYKNKVYDTVSKYMDSEQQRVLDEKKTQTNQDFTRNQSLFTTAMDNAQSNKDISAQSKILALDPKDPNYAQKISAINAGIRQTSGTGGSEILSVADAKALGVPYGTTKAQAATKGIIPGEAGTGGVLQLTSTKNKIDNISGLLGDSYLNTAVGPNTLARTSLSNFATGGKDNFIASVEQIRSQLSLDSLINAKAQGATFGALSEGELKLLQDSGSKLSTWAQKDKNGNTIGYKVSESAFKQEMDKINNFAKLDYLIKGGKPEDVGVKIMPDGSYVVQNSDGTYTQLK